MKPFFLELTRDEIELIKNKRRYASSRISERCLYILMNAQEHQSAPQIAVKLQRDKRTILSWLKSYKEHGINGLTDNYGHGRPATLRDNLKDVLAELLDSTPRQHNLNAELWTRSLLQQAYLASSGIEVSKDTISRALRDLGLSYKISRQFASAQGPSKPGKTKVERLVTKLF